MQNLDVPVENKPFLPIIKSRNNSNSASNCDNHDPSPHAAMTKNNRYHNAHPPRIGSSVDNLQRTIHEYKQVVSPVSKDRDGHSQQTAISRNKAEALLQDLQRQVSQLQMQLHG